MAALAGQIVLFAERFAGQPRAEQKEEQQVERKREESGSPPPPPLGESMNHGPVLSRLVKTELRAALSPLSAPLCALVKRKGEILFSFFEKLSIRRPANDDENHSVVLFARKIIPVRRPPGSARSALGLDCWLSDFPTFQLSNFPTSQLEAEAEAEAEEGESQISLFHLVRRRPEAAAANFRRLKNRAPLLWPALAVPRARLSVRRVPGGRARDRDKFSGRRGLIYLPTWRANRGHFTGGAGGSHLAGIDREETAKQEEHISIIPCLRRGRLSF